MERASTVIAIENVSKQYRLGVVSSLTLKEDLQLLWSKLTGKSAPQAFDAEMNERDKIGQSNYVWSLKDICLDIEKGEVVGIVGKNGAGKSTLLKLLSKVTSPTEGSIKLKGKIASLLEVGTGFHPELTGRENIFLNGAILGMRKAEIQRKLNDIIAFAGVERYIDTPVKRYSSGMYVRLAFAVAAHLESDILIIDEVLAVGDAEFQKKCIGKMKEVSQNEGRTVLFVSHNMDAIARLCTKCMYLKNGRLISYGPTNEILQEYISTETKTNAEVIYDLATAPGNDIVQLVEARILDENKKQKVSFEIDQQVGIQMTFQVHQPTNDLVGGFNLYNQQDIHILSSHDTHNKETIYEPGIYRTTLWIPANFLSEGLHYCGVALMSYKPFTVHLHDIGSIGFNITDKMNGETVRGEYGGTFPGVIRPHLKWDKIIQITK
jgi:lipopolysaccharide transport system ATP-binding protein